MQLSAFLLAVLCHVTLAGDSNTAHDSYIGAGQFELHEYSYLSTSYEFEKVAGWGWKSSDLLAAMQHQPPVGCSTVILIGTNDALSGVPVWEFESNLRQIVDMSPTPVLNTLPFSTHADVEPYNDVIWRVAWEQGVPVIDLYNGLADIGNRGLQYDGIHLSTPWDGSPFDFNENDLNAFGFNRRNLLTLEALNAQGR